MDCTRLYRTRNLGEARSGQIYSNKIAQQVNIFARAALSMDPWLIFLIAEQYLFSVSNYFSNKN